ncbi:MAG: hypothetical protein HY706_09655 [Candidatus Hydrogenedentes bacterium]|nr:hypothetical protein [Candidatus Hydrogenedentota bacterium]
MIFWWVLILFCAGAALLIAEFFVPGLVCGVLGGLCILGSCILGVWAYPDNALMVILLEILGTVVTVITGAVWFPHTRAAKAMILQTSQQAGAGWVAAETDNTLMGAVGEVYTPLRPAGTVTVNSRRINAVADGSFIEKGEHVRVIEVQGNRVVVEPAAKLQGKGTTS